MNFQDAAVVQTELNRINAPDILSEHEKQVQSDIWVWGLSINTDRIVAGQEPIKYDSMKEFVSAYWAEKLS